MYVKFNTKNESLEWYKKRSIFAKWAILNNADALAATPIKWKNLNNSTSVNISSFILIKRAFSSWVIFNLSFLSVFILRFYYVRKNYSSLGWKFGCSSFYVNDRKCTYYYIEFWIRLFIHSLSFPLNNFFQDDNCTKFLVIFISAIYL